MTILRPYHLHAVEQIRNEYARGKDRVLLVSPTGSGKTVMFSFVVSSATKRQRRVLILAHRIEIVEQISAALTMMSVDHGVIAPGYPPTTDTVQIASVAALARGLRRTRMHFDLIVVDEAHHAVAPTWMQIFEAFPKAKVLGVTATPQRQDGQGLSFFEALVKGPDVAELTRDGHLSPAVVYAPAEPVDLRGVKIRAGDFAADQLAEVMGESRIVGAAVAGYEQYAAGTAAVVFCCDTDHSRAVAARFAAAGVRSAHLDGDTPRVERRSILAALANGAIEVVTNAGLVSEGLDLPLLTTAILLRPTKSLAMYLQQVGRALRPARGKTNAIILDFAGNTFTFGLPGAERRWSLEGRDRKATPRLGSLPHLRHCRACGIVAAAGAGACFNCDAPFKQSVEIDVELKEIGRGEVVEQLRTMSTGQATRWAGASRDRLRLVAFARGFKSGWIWHRLQETAA